MTTPEPISPATRELFGSLRDLLLEQHKLLLDREKARHEERNGPIAGPGPFLALVLGDPEFAWLRLVSGLVVEIDEAMSRRSQAGPPEFAMLQEKVRETMSPRETGSDFQVRYYAAVQESPDVVILQCRIERLLGL